MTENKWYRMWPQWKSDRSYYIQECKLFLIKVGNGWYLHGILLKLVHLWICTYYMKCLLSSSQKYTFFCMKSSTHLNVIWLTKHSLTVFVSSHCLYMIDVFTLNTKFTTHFLPNSSTVRCDVNWYQLWYTCGTRKCTQDSLKVM